MTQNVEAVTSALIQVLENQFEPDSFGGQRIRVEAFGSGDLEDRPVDQGVSVYLYATSCGASSGSARSGGSSGWSGLFWGRDGGSSRRFIDLHYLLTPWAREVMIEHRLVGWMVDTLDRTPVLPTEHLRDVDPDFVRSDSGIAVDCEEVSTDTLVGIWNGLGRRYRMSVPCVAQDVPVGA